MAVRSHPSDRRHLPEAVPAPPGGHAGAQLAALVLPFLAMAVVAVIDVLAGPRLGLLPVLCLGPALAAVSLRPRQTLLVGVLALLVCAPVALYDGLLTSVRGVVAMATIAGVTAAGAVASAGRHRRERELADIRAVAEAAQRVLLRQVPARVGQASLAVRYVSASSSARIGGDLYEAVAAPGALRLIVADVQGKGLAAVQTAAVVLGAFRETAYDAAGLAEIAARIEISLARQAEPAAEFVTAILAQVGDGGSAVEMLSCGHPAPLLISGTAGRAARFVDLGEAGLPLGLAEIAVSNRSTRVLELTPGDRLLFYTDGITEARNRSGEFYPLGDRAALLADAEPDEALDRLSKDVAGHVGHQLYDDAAMLLLSFRPARQLAAAAAPAAPEPDAGTAVASSQSR